VVKVASPVLRRGRASNRSSLFGETMGTREAQDVLHLEVCDFKPMNGKTSQMASRESDQFIVLMKQGNACEGKGLTGARMTSGAHLPHSEVECR
jgi:hypothetical protein